MFRQGRPLLSVLSAGALAAAAGGCSGGGSGGSPGSSSVRPARADAPLGLAQATRSPNQTAAQRASAAHLVPDPEAAQSFAQKSSTHALAGAPANATTATTVAPGAPSDAEVRAELRQMQQAQRATTPAATAAGAAAGIDQQGNAQVPRHAPAAVARVIAGGNAIDTFPYVFGGGHASFEDNAYDCSGSVSYALAAAGMVRAPLTSGELMNWGVPGPGRWITVMANEGHTYMYVAGLRFDTSGRDGPLGTRWQPSARSNDGFVVRHWPGL